MWIVLIAAVALLVVLIGYARGAEHHRGDDVGAWSPLTSVVSRN
jgi:hypothetical protein